MVGKNLSGQGWVIARSNHFGSSNHISGTVLDPTKGRFDFIAFGASQEKSHRGQTLLLGNEVGFQLEDRGQERYVLTEAQLISDNSDIKETPEKLKAFFLLCDVWYHLLVEEKPYPETANIFTLLKTQKNFYHLVLVHLIQLFYEENLFPDWKHITPEEKSEYFISIDLPHWQMGNGSWRFLFDTSQQPLTFFIDKLPSQAVIQEILTLLRAAYHAYTNDEMFHF
ncbi:hypothetical protein [Thermospira aquatica]|uniref:Uncharacterized protein n=1 Tax=Thermospira aquatica TaxID=2828656 RepID=A0AAX3BFV9_9SPIR|nr:hypothetical protein [Thermospira aquatica]URA11065.1 hypothetical protein KDW03_04485 [Thermospira aquatica]